MKKISLIALLVLVGLLFAAPALRAQEAEKTESQKKAKALADLEDDEQLGNFLASLSPEELAAYIAAAVEYGDASLINRLSDVLSGMGLDIATVIGPNNGGEPSGRGESSSGKDQPPMDKLTEIATSLMENFADAGSMLDGDDFDTSNPVGNTAGLSRPEAE